MHGQFVPLPSTNAEQACIFERIAKNMYTYITHINAESRKKKTGVGFQPAGHDYNIFLKPLLDPGEFVLLNSPTPEENCPM